MDFFEQAHVVKERENKPKAIKKQLKMMLYGYKTNDTELIKEAENVKADLEDSTSVSGFSDLNLTASSADENSITKETYENSENVSNLDESVSETEFCVNQSTSSELNVDKDEESSVGDNISEDSVTSSNGSIIGYDEDISSITDISLMSRDESMALDSLEDSLTESSLSEFDPQGELAQKIHERLKAKGIIDKEKRKGTVIQSPIHEKSRKVKVKNNLTHEESNSLLASDISKSHSKERKFSRGVSDSSPYVSVTATDVEETSFNDILGHYKHPTIRNLPSDNHTAIFSTDSAFPAEIISPDITISNLEVSSLIPEIDDDLSVSDLVEVDTSVQNIDESALDAQTATNTTDTDMPLDVSDETIESEVNQLDYSRKCKVFYGNKVCAIILKHPCELYFHGKVIAKALSGKIRVFGHLLTEAECHIVAPLYSYAQCFKTEEGVSDNHELFSKLRAYGILSGDAEEILVNLDKNDGVLLLQPYSSPKFDFVAQNFTTTSLFRNNSINNYFEQASKILGCTLYSVTPQKIFKENPLWKRVMPSNVSPTIGIVCGGKGSGKSTFLRYYINHVVNQRPILVIDLDPGQSEFTVAGGVSATVVKEPIFGPSFTHLRKPNKILYMGIISTMDNIQLYVNSVKTILSYCKDNFLDMPWIINTMGMTNAVGLKFMTLIISLAQPDFVLQYDSKNPKKRYEKRLTPPNVTTLLGSYKRDRIFRNIESAVKDYSFIMAPEAETLVLNKSKLIPREERYLNFLAYFGGLVRKDNNAWLLGVIPYEVRLKDLYFASNIRLKEDCIAKVINGKVVALCQQATHDARVFTLKDKPLLCHGHGLVRGIDWEKEVLYVITPLSGNELCSVNTILYADWLPDLKGQEQCLPDGTEVPYRTTAQHHEKKLMTTPKRRFNPLQFLKMTRNS